MCDCKDIEIGTYDNQVTLKNWWNLEYVSIDTCLQEEILHLWSKRVHTTGCCCGHNKVQPYINVNGESAMIMINLGYEYWVNEFRVMCFKPKTIPCQD